MSTIIKKINWKNDNTRFVCILDIMGFKDLVHSSTHSEVKQKLIELSAFRKYIADETKKIKKGDPKFMKYAGCELRSISFSDSIIFVTNDGNPNDLELLSYAVSSIFNKATKLGVPLKGAISYGYFTANFSDSIFFGKPLINAFLLQEELQYYGVILDHYAENFYLDNIVDISPKLYHQLKTPLKKGIVQHQNLTLLNFGVDIEPYQRLYRSVSGPTRVYVDNTINMYKQMTEVKELLK